MSARKVGLILFDVNQFNDVIKDVLTQTEGMQVDLSLFDSVLEF